MNFDNDCQWWISPAASIILYAFRCEQETHVYQEEIRHRRVEARGQELSQRLQFSLTDIRQPFGRYNGERGRAAWGLSMENDRHASMYIHIHPFPSISVHVHTVSLHPYLFLSMSIRFYIHVHIVHPFLYVHVRQCPSFSIQVHQLSVHHPLSKSTNFLPSGANSSLHVSATGLRGGSASIVRPRADNRSGLD
jgi:hypothetical protein